MKPTSPPRWATRLLTLFCAPHLLEEVQGDLEERFQRRVTLFGERVAGRQYAREVLGFLRPFALKRRPNDFSQPVSINSLMFQNHFKIAWRSLLKQKHHAALNLVGLAIGLTACLLMGLYVYDELRYDRFHANADRIVRVVLRGTLNGEAVKEANVMAPVAGALRQRFPEIEATVRIRTAGTPRVSYGDKVLRNNRLALADPTLFRVFSLPLLNGDGRTALSRPNTVVVSQRMARQFFGETDPVGKVLTVFDDKVAYTVTGVMADVPPQSHFHADAFLTLVGDRAAASDNWLVSNHFTYLLLPDGYDPRRLEPKLKSVTEAHLIPPLEKLLGVSRSAFRQKGLDLGLFLQPLTEIHLHSDLKPNTELEPGGDIRYVRLFGAVALFMLLLACINFTNLSTAGAAKRAKEVGIRKVLGSARGRLVAQFLTESALLTALALALALGLAWALLPVFNVLSGKTLRLQPAEMPWLVPGLVGFGLLVSLLAGSYPAFFLASFRPVITLKGGLPSAGRSRLNLRNGLVVVQFFVSIGLTIATLVVYQQLRYIQTAKLGYDQEQVVVLERTDLLGNREAALARQLAQDSRVARVSVSAFLPNDRYNAGLIAMHPEGQNAKLTRLTYFGVDEQYLPTLGIQLAAGRGFSADFPSDSAAVLLNEAAARFFGWGRQAVGRTLTTPGAQGGADKTYRVVGVVKDFHTRSLHEPIAPMAMLLGGNSGAILVKTRRADVAGLLASVKTKWDALGTGEPFQYAFLDEASQAMYRAEQTTGRVLLVFAGLTIFIACLGLFGLATFTAEQRTKEIGVRKVLGASVAGLVALLARDFLKPVFVALLLAAPVAWYAMNRWLEDFAYRVELEWWVFAGAGLLAVAIALLTVGFQSVKAALVNPVESLRSE